MIPKSRRRRFAVASNRVWSVSIWFRLLTSRLVLHRLGLHHKTLALLSSELASFSSPMFQPGSSSGQFFFGANKKTGHDFRHRFQVSSRRLRAGRFWNRRRVFLPHRSRSASVMNSSFSSFEMISKRRFVERIEGGETFAVDHHFCRVAVGRRGLCGPVSEDTSGGGLSDHRCGGQSAF